MRCVLCNDRAAAMIEDGLTRIKAELTREAATLLAQAEKLGHGEVNTIQFVEKKATAKALRDAVMRLQMLR